ncbi:MAG: ACT domain-containing protein [Fusobacterium sp. JB021]|nr:ACT domain-containing protein [Fusobacterium sp. JB020]MDP0493187.1 ACT domain-containing protein [Fusobacterium sp. JB021]MDP0506107.1 ACT domain-containing protein [Fusobacterium sp. JB019]
MGRKKKGEIKDEGKKEYYIVDKRILPTSIQNVIKVNDLIQETKISKYEAIKKVGLSRSTYYKYKDYIKPFFESGQEKVFSIHLALIDEPGILARILDVIANHNMNVLTIMQNIAIDGVGRATITVQTTENVLRQIEGMLEIISEVDGVKELRIIGSN